MRRMLSGWAVAAALSATAHAEGGLPGSPNAVPDRPPTTAAAAPPDDEAGGALFSPFAGTQRASSVEPPAAPSARDADATALDSTLTIVGATVGGLATVAALWIFQRMLRG